MPGPTKVDIATQLLPGWWVRKIDLWVSGICRAEIPLPSFFLFFSFFPSSPTQHHWPSPYFTLLHLVSSPRLWIFILSLSLQQLSIYRFSNSLSPQSKHRPILYRPAYLRQKSLERPTDRIFKSIHSFILNQLNRRRDRNKLTLQQIPHTQ